MLAELAAANAAFSVIKSFVSNGRELGGCVKQISDFVFAKEQLEKTKNAFREIINPKTKSTISGAFYEDAKEEPKKKKIKEKLIPYYYEDGAVSFSEDEIRRFIKKEVRKELRKALPYEIKKHKEQRQNKLFQNILLGCGAWFLFMIMLS